MAKIQLLNPTAICIHAGTFEEISQLTSNSILVSQAVNQTINHDRYMKEGLAGYPLATPETPKHWLLTPEAESHHPSSENVLNVKGLSM